MAVEASALDAGLAPLGTTARRDRWAAVAAAAGGTFVLALLVGVVLAPSSPPPLSSRLRVHEYFVFHHDSALNQSLLVHGVAGIALINFVLSLRRLLEVGGARRVFVGAGLAAAAASFVQLDVVFRIENHIERGVGVRQTDVLFDALNRACALKFALLAVAICAVSVLAMRSGGWSRWLPRSGYVAAPVLVLAAVALVVRGPALSTSLTLSLPALVAWFAAASVAVSRRAAHSAA
jgi:hypothetical protein